MSVSPPTLDLRLLFALEDNRTGYVVTLQRSSDGSLLEQAGMSRPDLEALEQTSLASLRSYIQQRVSPEFQQALGRELAALLPDAIWQEIQAQWMRSSPCEGLRLRLIFSPECQNLAALPWEFLHLMEEPISGFPGGFFAQQSSFHLWREAQTTHPVAPLSIATLKVLIACADPGISPYLPLRHLKAEVEALKAALATEKERVEVVEDRYSTQESLRRYLLEFNPHILHFIGHGEERAGGGVLILHNGTGGTVAISGQDLAPWLKGRPLRLAILSACKTASSELSGNGVAQMLLAAGVPGVVAMQLPMRDSSGPKLTDELYRTLLRTGSIEEAVWQARHRVQDVGPDWGVLTLHIAGDNARLFDFSPALPPGPIHLPSGRNPRFVGRDTLMAEVHEALMTPDPVPATLVGLGGIGKTQFAIEYALKYQKDYPGGIFWFDARSTGSFLESYVDYGQSDFEVPSSLSARRAAMRVCDALQNLPRPALLICDNLNEGAELKPLPVVGSCRILITTREGWLVPQEYRSFKMPDLDADTAVGLLLSPDRTYSEEELGAARDLVEKVGRLPLALALIARPVRQEGFVAYRDRFIRHRIEELQQARRHFVTSTDHTGAIFDTIDISYQRLEPSARAVLHTASCFAGQGIAREWLRQACSLEIFDAAVRQLQDFSLLSQEENGRFTLHELLRVFAQGRMPEAERTRIVQQLAEMWTHLLTDTFERRAWREARAEITHYRALAELCEEEWAQADLAIQERRHRFLLPMAEFLSEQGEREEAIRCFQVGLQVVDSLYPERNVQAVPFLRYLAEARQGEGDRRGALAFARQALKLARVERSPTSPEWAEDLLKVGYLLRKLGHLRLALICYRRALTLLEAIYGRQHPRFASALNNLGVAYEHLDNLPPALEALNEALTIDEHLFGPDSVQVAIRLNNRGPVLGKMERWEEALSDYRRALAIYEGIHPPEHMDIINNLWILAEAHYALRQFTEARPLYQRVLPFLEKIAGRDKNAERFCKDIRSKLRLMDVEALQQDKEKGEGAL